MRTKLARVSFHVDISKVKLILAGKARVLYEVKAASAMFESYIDLGRVCEQCKPLYSPQVTFPGSLDSQPSCDERDATHQKRVPTMTSSTARPCVESEDLCSFTLAREILVPTALLRSMQVLLVRRIIAKHWSDQVSDPAFTQRVDRENIVT
ncbi:hypothetical protein RRG08_057855 [Elysia crispata]|uniref:Uncharacterized protein n=1 Tax=Elysia crispata TaxID=231223 RepID=A0AAE1E7B0_9GAST|nr:hypothetical protein RRG08_057855 [Elysia crispata]